VKEKITIQLKFYKMIDLKPYWQTKNIAETKNIQNILNITVQLTKKNKKKKTKKMKSSTNNINKN